MGGTAATPVRSTSLWDVTFVVLDLETTGFDPVQSGITEVGAVKHRGGERLATLSTLIDPGTPLEPFVTGLTGISNTMVDGAPAIDVVLPSLIEFVRGGVIVGHNIAFDRSFLDAALVSTGRPPLEGPFVDTLHLARTLLDRDDEISDHQLATVARHLRAPHAPCHRALADALATADVFHALLERLGTCGAFDLDALLRFPAA